MQQNYLGLKTCFLLPSICLCFFLFLTSCNDPIPPDPPTHTDHTPGDISENLVARIYFDASASMRGFVVPVSTQYKSILRPLESVITGGWNNGKTEFFSFGEQVQEINRDSYLSVGSVDFFVELRTYIQKIFEYEQQIDVDNPSNDTNGSAEENRLVVIVTDLFQDRGDVNLLISQLSRKYIRNGLEVGLLGLRSEFDGKVYNLDTSPILYRSTPGNPETFRPFYLLVLGRHADIAHYFDRLIATGFSDATDDVNTVIFSRYLVNPLLLFADAEITPENLNGKIINRDHRQNPRLKQYEIVRSSDPAKISAKLEYNPLRHAMFFDSNTVEASIVAEHKPDPEGKNEISLDAQRCLEVTSSHSKNDDSNGLSVEFSLDSQSLPNNRIYLYEVTLRPGIDTFKEPEWCSDWDMRDERNGAKTLNLVNFVRDLTHVTARMHHPIIAKFHCYIEKR